MRNKCRKQLAIVLTTMFAVWPTHSVRAEEFVAEDFGFRFTVPRGFHERPDDTGMTLDDGTPMTLKAYAEDEESVDDYLITIYIQRQGGPIDPRERLDPSQLPQSDQVELSIESRRWKELDLQVLRQDITADPNAPFVGYLIQFPLSEAILVRVQGPKSREYEVLKTFDKCVASFENTESYIVKIEEVPAELKIHGGAAFVFKAAWIGAIVGVLLLIGYRVRKSQVQES